MSSLSLSAIESLLRMTVATPVKEATFPIGSLEAACGSAGAEASPGCGEGEGDGVGCACASSTPGDASSTVSMRAASAGAGIARAGATAPTTRKPRSQIACESRLDVTKRFPGGTKRLTLARFQPAPTEHQMNETGPLSHSPPPFDAIAHGTRPSLRRLSRLRSPIFCRGILRNPQRPGAAPRQRLVQELFDLPLPRPQLGGGQAVDDVEQRAAEPQQDRLLLRSLRAPASRHTACRCSRPEWRPCRRPGRPAGSTPWLPCAQDRARCQSPP